MDSEKFRELSAFEVHDWLLYILANQYLFVLDAKSGIVLTKTDYLKDLFKSYSDVPADFSMELTPNSLLVFGYQKGKGPRGINIGIAKALSRPVMSEAILSLPPAMNQMLFSLLGNKDAWSGKRSGCIGD
ncbi:MAG: hypothetical protein ABIK28_03585 [Planctomycetota bacterium]